MASEIMMILEQMERERGISKNNLIEAIEQALIVAAKKVAKITDMDEEEDVRVHIDRETGDIQAFVGDQEITNKSLARIAAQTARQVIIQRLREAEKDVIYDEYKEKVGTLISGTVYRAEKGRIVIDLFGKAEAVVMRKELSPLDDFKVGERIRAYCLEVQRDKGALILASRRTAMFVRKLFDLEVPEIYDGIVEVKSIARDAGDRTKIAVCSKDDKVDCVGACVGMRGSRVKNIVLELRGEKIDIVRFREDDSEYIREALKPAEIADIRLEKNCKRAIAVVAQDQLSLAIGKAGQNVRLASRLTGWEIDVRTQAELDREIDELSELDGVGKASCEHLIIAGYQSLKHVANATVEDLSEVKGIGEAKASAMIAQARALWDEKKKAGLVNDEEETVAKKDDNVDAEGDAGDTEEASS